MLPVDVIVFVVVVVVVVAHDELVVVVVEEPQVVHPPPHHELSVCGFVVTIKFVSSHQIVKMAVIVVQFEEDDITFTFILSQALTADVHHVKVCQFML